VDPDPQGEFKTLVIPIKRVMNLFIIEAQVDTIVGNFIIDTGAPYLVLNQTYFRDYPKFDNREGGGIVGAANDIYTTVVSRLTIRELYYEKVQADVSDLSAIENTRNIKVLGLLGTNLFSKFAITIDPNKNVLYIQKVDKAGNIPEAERLYKQPYLQMPFTFMNNIILFKGKISDHPMWFAFDTAAETTLIHSKQPKEVTRMFEVTNRFTVTGIGGSKQDVLAGIMKELVFGTRIFQRNRAILTNLKQMNDSFGVTIDGMLGYDFFIRGVFTINFPKREFEMFIYKNG
jgi:hypothetical protein